MASDLSVGDSELPYLDVVPADNTTQAVLLVERPDGTNTAVAVSGGTLTAIAGTSPVQYSQRWTADQPIVYDQPRRWVLHWTVTEVGEGAEDVEVWVTPSPTAGGPAWTPGRSRVAAYIPHRTLVRNLSSTTESADGYAWTFDSTTTPPGTAVDRLIADGVAWVSGRVTPMHKNSSDAAAVCAALYAAAMIERSWPNDDQSLQRANDLERRLDVLVKDLAAANSDANTADGNPTYPLPAPRPSWSFPAADPRWDDARYF